MFDVYLSLFKVNSQDTERDAMREKMKERRERLRKKRQEIGDKVEAPIECPNDISINIEIQTEDTAVEEIQTKTNTTKKLKACQTVLTGEYILSQPVLSFERLKNNDNALHFFTGLENVSKFMLVFTSLQINSTTDIKYYRSECRTLSLLDQFLVTLIKIRQYKTNFELAYLFSVSETTIGNIFVSWVDHMYMMWKKLNIWCSRDLVSYHMPVDFKRQFPNTRVILDGLEIPIMKPQNPISQQLTFSTYKNKNTLKVVVGVSPGGLVTFISPAYGGATSDREVIARSDLMRMCDSSDSIMADKGFNIQDLFVPYNITINIPTFMTGKNKLPGVIIKKDRKIASKRVHVERVIGLAKTFKILKGPLNHSETRMGSKIVYVCFFLCNFRKCIVSKTA